MDPVTSVIELLLHFDEQLPLIIQTYGAWTYPVLFGIIFCETGLVVLPYLPGDSLLFVAGALAGSKLLDPWILIITLSVAAILGDTLNYWIGRYLGMKIFERGFPMVKKEHLERTEHFFAKYGGKTIVIARFIPFIRTFAPFLAGVGNMRYRWFIAYNVIGGILWVLAFTLAGYFFGNLPIVQENFNLMIYAIIGLSLFAVVTILVGMARSVGKGNPPEKQHD